MESGLTHLMIKSLYFVHCIQDEERLRNNCAKIALSLSQRTITVHHTHSRRLRLGILFQHLERVVLPSNISDWQLNRH